MSALNKRFLFKFFRKLLFLCNCSALCNNASIKYTYTKEYTYTRKIENSKKAMFSKYTTFVPLFIKHAQQSVFIYHKQFNAPKNLSRIPEYILKEGWSLPITRRDSKRRKWQKNGRVGVRKEGREKCHTFLGTNLRGETAATPSFSLPSRSPPQHPPPCGPVYCFTYSPTGQQRYFVYKFWLLWGVVHHRPFSADAVQPLPDSPVSLYCGFSVTQGWDSP